MNKIKIEVSNGCFGYSKQANILQDINFTLEEGNILAIMGQNGIGKTTLQQCLMGILKWNSGEMKIDDQPFNGIKSLDKISYVPQVHQVSFPYTVSNLVCMGRTKKIKHFAMPSKEDREIAMECLEEVGISDIAEKKCQNLSGGQLQLVFLARALAAEPELLVLDEPENHLDFKNQLHILKVITTLVRKRNMSCIMNTHNPENALRFSDNVLMLGRGDYIFGETNKILTESNIKKYFNVNAKIIDLVPLGISSKTCVIMDKESVL